MKELESLNPQQKEAVLHDGSPLLILAGAGSGKTRVITTKIAHLTSSRGYDPRSILAVTFTNKAAGEMKDRVLDMAPGASEVMIRTFHSFGAWLLRRHSHLLGLQDRFSIYDDDDSLALLTQLAGEGYTRSDLRPMAQAIALAKDRNLRPADDLSAVSLDSRLPELYGAYQGALQEMGNADFGDLIMRAVELLENNPPVRARIRNRFRVILVDEYQDSNHAQFLLLKQLYQPETYLCVVGDEDQSIYRFRGADVSNILDFPKVFPDTTIIRLEQNYRSTERIITAASQVVTNNTNRLGKNLWTRNPLGEPIKLAELPEEGAEAEYCASLLEDDPDPEGTAIVYRNNYQSRSFENLFTNRGIPYRIVGAVRFLARAEVKDAVAYMALLANPRDVVAFQRAINRPPRGLGKVSQQKILSFPEPSMVDRCRLAGQRLKGKPARAAAGFYELMEDLRRSLDSPSLAGLAEAVVHRTGLLQHYRDQDVMGNRAREDNLQELVNACRQYTGGMEGLTAFLERAALDSSADRSEGTEHGVTLITAHNTKGLEFDRVIVTGMEEGLFPYYRDFPEEETMEEERRLFYVAMTRARRELHLTYCNHRRVFGMLKERSASRFLAEIPKDAVENAVEAPQADPYPEYFVGCGVYHDDYGPGQIVRKWQNGRDTLVLVQFAGGRTARFILAYTPLERISADEP